jgi:arginine decarboxylase
MFEQAFPIVIVDEDFEGKHAAGRAVRQLAEALGGQGFPVVSGFGYQDARRLARIYHNESCLLVSVDGAEAATGQWSALEELLTVTRQRNTRLPIFLLGDERSAESVPTSVLRHAQAFFRLHEESPEFLARTISRAAQSYLETLLPPTFKALTEYAGRAHDSWHPPGHGGGVAFRKTPVGRAFYEFFGENTLRSDMAAPVGELGSLVEHSGAVGAGERNASRIFGSDHTLFIVGGAASANRIVWQALVTRGDIVLCDRNCPPSILHAMIMTGAVPIYLQPSRNRFGIVGPISRDQFTAESIQQKIKASPHAAGARGRVRLLALTNSTRDGICYNVDAIKHGLGETVDVLHFDEEWFAYANFHDFYAQHHAVSSAHPRRARRALTAATQSTHKLLAAFSPGAMLHLLDGESERADMTRFNEAFSMHTPTSPQYGVLASCDVAASMMEQPAGRAIVEETIDEALAFRRAMSGVKRHPGGSWWFDVWQPPAMAEYPVPEAARWRLNASDRWHGFGQSAPEDLLLDPVKVTLLSPGLQNDGRGASHVVPASVVARFLSSRRIEVEKTGLYSFLVLFSMGTTKGKWSTLVTELLNFRDLYDRNAAVRDILPALANASPEAYAAIGLKDLCIRVGDSYCKTGLKRAFEEMYATLPDAPLLPTDGYERLVRGQVERVEIDQLMNRTVAVTVLPSTPGPALLVPGERLTRETSAISDYLKASRQFETECPGLEPPIRGLRFDRDASGRRDLIDCVKD